MELGPGDKEDFLTQIYKALASISTLREKVSLEANQTRCRPAELGALVLNKSPCACPAQPKLQQWLHFMNACVTQDGCIAYP